MASDLPAYVQALLKPGAYPEPVSKIDLMQTQMSFIFLTGEYTYKTKKPVNLGYLDYTNLEKRLFFCRQELELNRRLCPEAYLDVLPVTKSGGKFTIGGDGTLKGCQEMIQHIEKQGLNISIVAVPKTIDNDIMITNRTFGFETAVDMSQIAIKVS